MLTILMKLMNKLRHKQIKEGHDKHFHWAKQRVNGDHLLATFELLSFENNL